MRRRQRTTTLALAALLVLSAASNVPAGGTISFGTLPVIQALPLFVAEEKGLFVEEGLDVNLVPFRSGLEKDAAMAAKQLQGYFGDMLTSIILGANQVPMRMVATVFNTTGNQRMFAVLAAPGTGRPSLAEVAGKGIAGSSNTVIEYVIVQLLKEQAPGAELKLVETKNILARMPMLLEGKVAAAALPEPLVTLVETKGATVVADDRGKGIAPTVLIFSEAYIKENANSVRKFLRAVSRASELISEDPEAYRSTMIRYARVPEPLQQSISIPVFPTPSVPDETLVANAYGFLNGKGVLKRTLTPDQMVRSDLLP